MYNPPHFRETELSRIHDFIETFNFGILFSGGEASHLPFLLDRAAGERGVLYAHVARANRQWEAVRAAGEVLVVFPGPDAYISPIHYRDTLPVPTWNYVAAHAYGRARVIEEPDAIRAILERMVAFEEARNGTDWRTDAIPSDTMPQLLRQIVAFEIPIARLEGKWKLGQNRDAVNRRLAAEGLLATERPRAVEVGRLMLEELEREDSKRAETDGGDPARLVDRGDLR
jgi:transcriptional regulator